MLLLLLLLLAPLALALPLACLPLALARLDMSLLVWPRLVLLVRLLLVGLAAWPVVLSAAAARLVALGFLVAFELRVDKERSHNRASLQIYVAALLSRPNSSQG
jgi:hypothetical protein